MVLVRSRSVSCNEFWVEVLENNIWRQVGSFGDSNSAEEWRCTMEQTLMAKEQGIW
jgi:hypothetical protein